MKKIRRYVHEKRYKRFLSLMKRGLTLWVNSEYARAELMDRRAAALFCMLGAAHRNSVLYLLAAYFDAVKYITKFRFDRGEGSSSIAVWTDVFTRDSRKFASEDAASNNVLRRLMLANLSAYRPTSFRLLLDAYLPSFKDPTRRAELIYHIANEPCGEMPITHVRAMIDSFAGTMESFMEPGPGNTASTDWRRKTYLRCTIRLAYGCGFPLPEADAYVRREIESGDMSFSVFLPADVSASDLYPQGDSSPQAHAKSDPKADYIRLLRDPSVSRQEVADAALRAIEASKAEVIGDGSEGGGSDEERFAALGRMYYFKREYAQAQYWARFEHAMNLPAPPPKMARGSTVYFLVNDFSIVGASNALPILLEAARRGLCTVPTSPLNFRFAPIGDEWLDGLAGSFLYGMDLRREYREFSLPEDLLIDIPGKRIIVNGMNIYQPVYEFVSRYQFSYFFRYEEDAWARMKTSSMIRVISKAFAYCREIEEWAEDRGIWVKFISATPHIIPGASFRIFCEEARRENPRAEFICVSPGYDNYFKNIGDAMTETVCALNLTRHTDSRTAFLGTRQGFETFLKKNRERFPEFEKKIEVWLSHARGRASADFGNAKKDLLARLDAHREKGGNIILLCGKVIFDLAVRSTKGVVHEDMSHWITHTVEIANRNPDTLLLIKPHPHERLRDLTLTDEKTDTLRDLIMTEMGNNVIYLDSDMFRLSELVSYADIGILWNGTSALEFAAQGLKTLFGDYWAYCDYPIGFAKVGTMEEYENALLRPQTLEEPPDIRERAIMFLAYTESESVRIPNPYSRTSSLNFRQFESEIDEEAIANLLAGGDSLLAEYFDSLE